MKILDYIVEKIFNVLVKYRLYRKFALMKERDPHIYP
jgi:hypothetical protein